ncbi:hypothetical protein [Brazilian marseillevirus]|uniref:hypothetical protein n=1 Tax=Brazilian marseillevirus TaxID=1813599 RepID=UPI000785753A|nr:hypothetical protein A3303_gp063 [Brazilian marseillevirus]AMQ10571.1 hypothetical protein [Brazilian marseillevirus]
MLIRINQARLNSVPLFSFPPKQKKLWLLFSFLFVSACRTTFEPDIHRSDNDIRGVEIGGIIVLSVTNGTMPRANHVEVQDEMTVPIDSLFVFETVFSTREFIQHFQSFLFPFGRRNNVLSQVHLNLCLDKRRKPFASLNVADEQLWVFCHCLLGGIQRLAPLMTFHESDRLP